MTLRERIGFFKQLAVLARAGVPLRNSLQRLEGRSSGREVAILSERISAGAQVGDAFSTARFSPFECHLIAAGERSARLEVVFQHLADFWARESQMRGAILRQLYYPLAVLHFSIIVGALFQLVNGTFLNVIVSLIWSFSLLYAFGFILYTLIRVSWQSEAMQAFWLHVPLIGSTLSTAYAYRWITALRLEFSAGVPMPEAVADAWRASGYVNGETLAVESQQALRQGTELSVLMPQWRRLPKDWVDFVETGEISGALETALENLETEAGQTWDIAQQRMNTWMPKIVGFIILVVVSAQVGWTVYSLYTKEVTGPMEEVERALNGG